MFKRTEIYEGGILRRKSLFICRGSSLYVDTYTYEYTSEKEGFFFWENSKSIKKDARQLVDNVFIKQY